MSGPAVVTRSLTKDYGSGRGVFDLDLVLERGEVFGFLGPNGSGKSTTIRMLLDLVRPTSGSVRVLGHDPRRAPARARRRVGYVPGELSLWPTARVSAVLQRLGELRGGVDPLRVAGLAEALDLDVDRVVSDLSKGNKQKVALVAALAPDVDLLVLDEPTSGLDPLLQVLVHDLVRERAAAGAAVLLSSHVLGEVQSIAKRVGVVRSGRLVSVLDVSELSAQAAQTLEVTFAHDAPADWPGLPVEVIARRGTTGTYRVQGSVDAFVKALAQHTVVALHGHDADLEQAFLRYYRDDATAVR